MDRKIYDYSGTAQGLIALRTLSMVVLWCIPLLYTSSINAFHIDNPDLRSNGLQSSIFLASIATIYLLYCIVQATKLLRESITIENGQVTYVDKDSRKLSCALTDIISIETVESDLRDGTRVSWRNRADMYRALTTAGNIWFYPSIGNFADLQKTLSEGAARHAALHPNDMTECPPSAIHVN